MLVAVALPIVSAGEGKAAAAACPATGISATASAELIMVEDLACAYCARWNREVAPAYPNSAEGRFAPLTRVTISHPRLKSFKPITHTPTFIVVSGENEIGRLTGYPGADFFWPLLSEQLAKAGYRQVAETVSKNDCPQPSTIR